MTSARANITIERRGPAFAQRDFNELRPGKRKGRKEIQYFLSGLRGLCLPGRRQFAGRAPGSWRVLVLIVSLLMASALRLSAQPVITDVQPRGAQKGKPFTLTLTGRNLGEGAKIRSTLPASFTLLTPDPPALIPGGPMPVEGRSATFLVEPTAEAAVGVYAIRVVTGEGISNVQLFTVGAFPELTEDESRSGALPNTDDTTETAQPLPAPPFTLNGTLRGPERDVFRLSARAGEQRVIEVEARRSGSAIDPQLEILDANGKVIERSEDAPLLGLDPRVDVVFPKDGDYYVVVRDARFSTQTANFYRLKVGSYAYPREVFPLGGRRGELVETSLGAGKIKVDLRNASSNVRQVFVNVPGSPALPVPFAVGDDPEINTPVGDAPISVPVTINARLAEAGQVDRYTLRVPATRAMTLRLQARELGTSRLMAVITVRDEHGNVLGRSGDEPLAEDLYNVNQSRTAGDPMLRVQPPAGVDQVLVSVEDLALRGGPSYAYRLNVQPVAQDFRVILNVPFVNVPAEGSVAVPVTVQRQGFDDEIQLRVANAPKGLRIEGGYVVAGQPVKETPQNRNSRGVLILTAEPGETFESLELTVEGVARLPDGTLIVRKAEGPGMIVNVAGASEQGAVDRQRPLTAPWMGLELVTAATKPRAATLEVTMVDRTRMAEGDQIRFRWKWIPRDATQALPRTVNAEMVGSADVRVIDMQVDAKDSSTGTFLMTTTKLTRPSKYDIFITGRLTPAAGVSGVEQEDIVSRPITVQVDEVRAGNAETASRR
jgi:hypothetical protein